MKYVTILLLIIIIIFVSMLATKKPTNNRDWGNDQTLLPLINIENDIVNFQNVRNFTYTSEFEYNKEYQNKTFNLSDLTSVDYIVVPFGTIGGAHTFLSFGFNDEEYIAISVEIRKEKGEVFSAIKGLFRAYEIMYVVATEEDAIKLRTNYRNNDVYLYPTNGSTEKKILLLKNIAKRINNLNKNPEFYNTVLNNCTTNIAQHINNINDETYQVPWNINLLLPENSDVYAKERDFLAVDETLSVEVMREKYFISNKAREALDIPFSKKIRVDTKK